jgi:hypothetical protein
MKTLANRINKIEETCKYDHPNIERERTARIKICEMLLECDLEDDSNDLAERMSREQECSELRQEIADLKAGRFDEKITEGFSQPRMPFNGDERARRGIAMLCKDEAEHERRLNFWRAKLANQGAGNVA